MRYEREERQTRTIEQAGDGMTGEKRSSDEEVVDMEAQCAQCHARLYVPISQINEVLASLERTGAVILICVCGQAQLVQSRGWMKYD